VKKQEIDNIEQWLRITNQMVQELDLNGSFEIFWSAAKIEVIFVPARFRDLLFRSVLTVRTYRSLPSPSHSWIMQVVSNSSHLPTHLPTHVNPIRRGLWRYFLTNHQIKARIKS
jgi:hypothetical protein